MKATGIILLIIGAIAFLVGFTMDTSIATDFGSRRVHNIGLMNDRQNIIIAAGVLAVIGAIFVARRSLQPIESAAENSSVRTCPYCAETIKEAAAICRFCQRELPPIAALVAPQVVPPNDEQLAQQVALLNDEQFAPQVVLSNDEQLMNDFGITFDGERYCFENGRYDKLADATTYAKLAAASREGSSWSCSHCSTVNSVQTPKCWRCTRTI